MPLPDESLRTVAERIEKQFNALPDWKKGGIVFDAPERKTPMDPQAAQGAEGAHAIARALRDAELDRRLEKEGPGADEVRAHAAQFEKAGPPPPTLEEVMGPPMTETQATAFAEATGHEQFDHAAGPYPQPMPQDGRTRPRTEAEELLLTKACRPKDQDPAREFIPGMVVKLRGGRVIMTVELVADDGVKCVWFNKQREVRRDVFLNRTLMQH